MRRVLTLVLTGAVLAATAAGAAQAAGNPDPVSSFRVTPPEWRTCAENGTECGALRVPLDWAHPKGEQITVAVTRLKAADPAHRIGVLYFNPGGPDGPATPILKEEGKTFFPKEILDRFDVIGVDPRGVGDSVPAIACEKPTMDLKVTQFPRTRAEYDRLIAYNREVGEGCRRATGPLIDHVDTVSAARDFEALRIALGAGKVSWLGLSYGTLLGATYAQLYPNRVRAAVLDGALDHTFGSRRFAADEARSTEDVFGQFATWCQSTQDCALRGKDIVTEYRELLSRADRKPIPATGFPAGASSQQIAHGTGNGLYLRSDWPLLAKVLAGAMAPTPDATIFGRSMAGSPGYRTIACHDFPSDVRGYEDLLSRQREVAKLAPTTRGYVEAWDVQTGCLGWPIRPANPWGPTPVRGTPPLLVVSGKHDPATPYSWGVGLAGQIAGSHLLTWEGTGHTAYFNDPATQAREVAYLLDPQQ